MSSSFRFGNESTTFGAFNPWQFSFASSKCGKVLLCAVCVFIFFRSSSLLIARRSFLFSVFIFCNSFDEGEFYAMCVAITINCNIIFTFHFIHATPPFRCLVPLAQLLKYDAAETFYSAQLILFSLILQESP